MTQKISSKFSVILFSNGVYQGFIQNNVRQGVGVYVWDSGEFYFGEWNNDNIEGEGYFFQQTGAFMHAYFLNNKVNGPGILKLCDSNLILGYWNKGNLTNLAYKYFQKQDEWFLCEFTDNEFTQCSSKGKGFPQGLPNIELSKSFSDLTDMTEIIEKSNEKLKEMQIKNQYEFVYKNFDDGGVYIGLTKDKIPHGYGIFKFSDDKTHIGFYQNGILSGPCFIQFQNGDFYCGDLKKGKFDGVSLLYQKNKEIWLNLEYKAGVQQKILSKSIKFNNESKEISRANFKKTAEFTLKNFTPNNLFNLSFFPAIEDLKVYLSKDWGLSPIKISRKLTNKTACCDEDTDRKINIYEIILNDKPQIQVTGSLIKVNQLENKINDSINENLKINQHRNNDSQHILSDISQKEQFDEPRELSFHKNAEIPVSNQDNNKKQSNFSKMKDSKTNEENEENMDDIEDKINQKFKEKINEKNNIKYNTEPNEIYENENNEIESKINHQFSQRIKNEESTKINNEIEIKINEKFKDKLNKSLTVMENKSRERIMTEPTQTTDSKKNQQIYGKNIRQTFKVKGSFDVAEELQNKNKEKGKNIDKQKYIEQFSNDIKKITKDVQNVIQKVEDEKKNEKIIKNKQLTTNSKDEKMNDALNSEKNKVIPKPSSTNIKKNIPVYLNILGNPKKFTIESEKNKEKGSIDTINNRETENQKLIQNSQNFENPKKFPIDSENLPKNELNSNKFNDGEKKNIMDGKKTYEKNVNFKETSQKKLSIEENNQDKIIVNTEKTDINKNSEKTSNLEENTKYINQIAEGTRITQYNDEKKVLEKNAYETSFNSNDNEKIIYDQENPNKTKKSNDFNKIPGDSIKLEGNIKEFDINPIEKKYNDEKMNEKNSLEKVFPYESNFKNNSNEKINYEQKIQGNSEENIKYNDLNKNPEESIKFEKNIKALDKNPIEKKYNDETNSSEKIFKDESCFNSNNKKKIIYEQNIRKNPNKTKILQDFNDERIMNVKNSSEKFFNHESSLSNNNEQINRGNPDKSDNEKIINEQNVRKFEGNAKEFDKNLIEKNKDERIMNETNSPEKVLKVINKEKLTSETKKGEYNPYQKLNDLNKTLEQSNNINNNKSSAFQDLFLENEMKKKLECHPKKKIEFDSFENEKTTEESHHLIVGFEPPKNQQSKNNSLSVNKVENYINENEIKTEKKQNIIEESSTYERNEFKNSQINEYKSLSVDHNDKQFLDIDNIKTVEKKRVKFTNEFEENELENKNINKIKNEANDSNINDHTIISHNLFNLNSSPIKNESPQKSANISVLNQINQINTEMDWRIKQWEEKKSQRKYTKLNCNLEDINQYYDCLEKCYTEIGVEKEELLNLIIKRFKEELDRKFPHLANFHSCLYQKFNLPIKTLSNKNEIFPLTVKIPLD